MVKGSKGKSRLDKFYHLAKEQGFRSRAAFKLIQLNKKYNFFTECRTVLDLCAAPGGWMQVAVKHMPVSSLVVGVDLIPIRPIRGATALVGDITTEKCKKQIEQESAGQLFDIVLNDGSPNVGGAWHSESLSQAMLVLDALKLATAFLAPKGWFISKVDPSVAPLLEAFDLFVKVEATKPSASRNASAEIFIVCQGYKAPAQIDPKLLDPRHVLQEYGSHSRMHGPLVMQKRQTKKMHRRFRDGYEDGASTTFKPASIMSFIKATDPIEVLGLYTQFKFEPAELPEGATDEERAQSEAEFSTVMRHKKTTEEIRQSCADLLVLGKKEFKKLLKWQLAVVKQIKAQRIAEKAPVEAASVDPEERMLKEMALIQERIQHKAKKKEKKQREMKKQAKKRLAQFKQTEGMVEESLQDTDLFGLDVFGEKGELEKQSVSVGDPDGLDVDSGSESGEAEIEGMEDDELKLEAMTEDYLERSYLRYLQRRGEGVELEDKTLKRRKRLDQTGALSEEEADLEEMAEEVSEDEAVGKVPGGGLLVKLDSEGTGAATGPDAISAQWFSQEIFQDEDLNDATPRPPSPKPPVIKDESMSEASDYERLKDTAAEGMEVEEGSDFEVVSKEAVTKGEASETDTEDEFRMLDLDGKAEIIAMARKMLKRKEKESIIDAAYSRYIFHDKHLPKWFEHDNDVYNRPQRMVTRAEIEAEKEMLRAMDSRPIKKVAEAKSRKAKRMATRLRNAMKRAEGISNQEELSHRTRMRQMTTMMNKARKKEDTKFVTADQLKKMGRAKRRTATRKMPLKDKRLKSDKRMRGMGREAKNLKQIKEKKSVEKQRRRARKQRS